MDLRQLGDVRDEAFIRAAVFEGDEDFAVHGASTEQASEEFGESEEIREILGVERDDDSGGGPSEDVDPARVCELAHFFPVAREGDERHDGEGKLQAQDDLAEDEQIIDGLVAHDGDEIGRAHV